MSKMRFFFLLGMSFLVEVFSQEMLDVETLPHFRSQQYSMEPYQKIVVFSAPRTGSSLIYNVFRFLFEDEAKLDAHHHDFDLNRRVLKTHRVIDLDQVEQEENVLYIFAIRNPFLACVSNYRISPRVIQYKQSYVEDLLNRHRDALLLSEKMEAEGKKVVRLFYEHFADHVESIFDFIETHFSLAISDGDKQWMKRGYSKENIYLCTQHFANFDGFLPISGFHGLHINLKGYTPPRSILYWIENHRKAIEEPFKKYGY